MRVITVPPLKPTTQCFPTSTSKDNILPQPEASPVAQDVRTKPLTEPNVAESCKSTDKNCAEDYVARLACLVQDYRVVVANLTNRQTGGPSILTKEWLVRCYWWVSLGVLHTELSGGQHLMF